MIRTVFRRLVLGEPDPDYLATHVSFWPDRFALVRLPDSCPVCARPGTVARDLEGVEWVAVALRGGFKEVRRSVLPAKTLLYCGEHAPDPSTDAAALPV